MDRKTSTSLDTVQLALRMSQILRRPFSDAHIVDRGAYASVYQLTEKFSPKYPKYPVHPAVLVRVSSRPVYNDVAIDQERQKIAVYVATLSLIHASAPKQVLRRLPQILAYDASSSAEFGHGWIAMTRVRGVPIAECWLELDIDQRRRATEELASFTRKLARFKSSASIGSISATSLASQAASSHGRLIPVPLSLPGRNGADNLRPFARPRANSTGEHGSSASFLKDAVDAEIAFLRQHQKPAVRCYNVNMLRLRQCGMDDEVPCDASFASTTSSTYRKQLRALGTLAETITIASPDQGERFVMAHLDLSPENVLVDPETGAVTGVVDWEFSGYVPEWVALAPPSWISDEWLPSWNGSNWIPDGYECEMDPFDVGTSRDATEAATLRTVWEKEASWEPTDFAAAKTQTQEKRRLWKACLGEWHQLERACAWARAAVYSKLQPQGQASDGRPIIDLSYSDSDATQDDNDFPARCPSPSTAESSIGPYTPVDAVPTRDLPFHASARSSSDALAGKLLDRYDLKLSLKVSQQASEYGDDEAGISDHDDLEESDEGGETPAVDDLDFEDFAMAFEPPPLPHTIASQVTVQSSHVAPESMVCATPTAKRVSNSIMGCQNTVSMNSKIPPSNLPAGSPWAAFWDAPKLDVSRDLDFVIERDLDAGW